MFEINGTEFPQIEIANWEHNPHSTDLDLRTTFNNQKIHTWIARVLSMAKWSILEPLQGQVVSLSTTNHEDRNSTTPRIYPTARIVRLSGDHNALDMRDVEIEFKVA